MMRTFAPELFYLLAYIRKNLKSMPRFIDGSAPMKRKAQQ